MASDTPAWWNEIWESADNVASGSDDILKAQIEGLSPGRALEIGCGAGGNAVWLAGQGWQVTAVDFSEVGIERCRLLAAERAVEVDFVVADAASYQPEGMYDLITSFYIQLWPEQRVRMLSNAAKALAPGGVLLFVSHDKSNPPHGWADEDLLSLTTPEEVVAELSGLKIEQAYVLEHDADGHQASHMHDSDNAHDSHGSHDSHSSSSTIVRAIRIT